MNKDALSFRDPGGHVYIKDGKIFRALTKNGKRIWDDLNKDNLIESLVKNQWVVPTWENHTSSPPDSLTLEHQQIPFISYSFEWPFHLLKKAALHHLNLMGEIIPRGFILKDASPNNIQFIGTRPVLIDILSIERLIPGDLWAGYGQFCDTMLYSLMLMALKGIPYHPWLRGSPNGIEPQFLSSLFSWGDIFKPGVFTHVKLRSMLHKKFNRPNQMKRIDVQQASFPKEGILRNVRHLKNVIDGLNSPSKDENHWLTYAEKNTYSPDAQQKKERFVLDQLAMWKPELVWDVGCNTGTFTKKVATTGAYCVGFDSDSNVIQQLAIDCDQLSINNLLPLIIDWANPSPSQGWDLKEIKSIFERRQPAVILALALVHHLAIQQNVPLALQLKKFSELAEKIIIEFVDRNDPMTQELLLNVGTTHEDYTEDEFARSVEQYFKIVSRLSLSPTRTIYSLTRLQSTIHPTN